MIRETTPQFSKVEEQLINAGWRQDSILREQLISAPRGTLRPDFVLLHNLYPLGVVEISSPTASQEDSILQAMGYAEALGISAAFVADGDQIVQGNSTDISFTSIERWPTPEELWRILGHDISDPRIFPPAIVPNTVVRLYQAQAVSRTLDALLNGGQAFLSMAIGSGATFVALQIAWKMLKSGNSNRLLYLRDREIITEQTLKMFNPFGNEVVQRHKWKVDKKQALVHIAKVSDFLKEDTLAKIRQLPDNYYDLIFLHDIAEISEAYRILSDHFPRAKTVAITSNPVQKPEWKKLFGQISFVYSRQDAIFEQELKTPPGYRAVSLKEIATISQGFRGKSAGNLENQDILNIRNKILLSARDIEPDGTVSTYSGEHIAVNESELHEQNLERFSRYSLQPKDILIPRIGSGSKIRVGMVSNHFDTMRVLFSDSVLRIRVNPEFAQPEQVFDFLRSELGQIALQRLLVGSTIPQVSRHNLEQLLVFLPEAHNTSQEPKDELSGAANAIRELREVVIPELKQAVNDTRGNPDLSLVADRLRKLADTLFPPTLFERVISGYPTPVALACRRYTDAQFNNYEQVLRLRDLFEAVGFFLYNVLLADALRSPSAAKLHRQITNSGIRKAFEDFSMARRINCIEEMIRLASSDKNTVIFMRDLVNTKEVAGRLQKMQRDFRNKISHTATASERYQQRLIEEFEPEVKSILESLSFLETYRLARIPAYYYKKGKLYRRMEIYRGVGPRVVEEILPDEIPSSSTDFDHLVLLNPEGQSLDLHPIYQHISNEQTRYETHICFLKQQKGKELSGESIQGAFEVALEGYDDFEALRKRLLQAEDSQV